MRPHPLFHAHQPHRVASWLTASLLLLGHRRRRAAGLVGVIIVCLAVGMTIGNEVANRTLPPPPPPLISQPCMSFPTPTNATAICSDLPSGVSCDACESFGKPMDTGERNCPIGCLCTGHCIRGNHPKPQDDGDPGLYIQQCLETGEWQEPYTSRETACVDTDECTSHPCQHGGTCSARPPVTADSYHCTCLPGSVGENCEEDIDGTPGPLPRCRCRRTIALPPVTLRVQWC